MLFLHYNYELNLCIREEIISTFAPAPNLRGHLQRTITISFIVRKYCIRLYVIRIRLDAIRTESGD